MAVYMEIGTENKVEVVLVSSFTKAVGLDHDVESVAVKLAPAGTGYAKNRAIELPIPYRHFRALFAKAVASNEILDMRDEALDRYAQDFKYMNAVLQQWGR